MTFGKMRFFSLACWGVLLLIKQPSAFAQVDSDAAAILQAARVNPLGQPISLAAQLRAGTYKVPFQMLVRNGVISYVFENPHQEIILRLDENSSKLEERRGGKTNPVSPARFDDSVRGGLITYEDLALRFLYWKHPRLLGEETIHSFPAYKIEIPAPPSSQYGVVRIWIAKKTGALMRIEGYDRNGRLSKRFEVISAQKMDGQWMLKQMRVERIDPDSRKVTGRTYLEILGTSK